MTSAALCLLSAGGELVCGTRVLRTFHASSAKSGVVTHDHEGQLVNSDVCDILIIIIIVYVAWPDGIGAVRNPFVWSWLRLDPRPRVLSASCDLNSANTK